MEAHNKPEMNLLHTGSTFKTLKVSALAGMFMPLHHATGEAVIVVQEGKAIINLTSGQHPLESGDSFIIPAMENHSLEIISNFKAIVIMSLDSEIEF